MGNKNLLNLTHGYIFCCADFGSTFALDQRFSNFLFHRPLFTLDMSFSTPKPDKANTRL